MKKLSLFLALIMVLTLCVCSFSIGISAAARPIDAFTQVEKPDPSTIRKTTFSFYRVWGVENPVGEWDLFAYKDGGMGEGTSLNRYTNAITYVDNNKAALVINYNDYDRHTLTELVFADYFTISGGGNGGRTRINQETWDKVTVVVSDDARNWRKVNFTVSYHTENATFLDRTSGNESPVDLYWHLTLEETTTATYFAIHTSEAKAWDADDHAPRLGIILDRDFFYGVNTSGIETDRLGDVRYLYSEETQAKGTVGNASIDADGTLTHGGFLTQTGVFSAWLYNGNAKSFPYIELKTPVYVNEMVIGDVSHWHQLPLYTDYDDLEIYYTDDVDGTWSKANVTVSSYDCTRELNGTYQQGIRFVFDEGVTAKYFMLYDPDPKANEIYLHCSTFSAVYDPANDTSPDTPDTNAPETNAPETNAPETNAPETNAPETNAPETGAPETGAPETNEPEAPAENDMTWLYIVIAAAVVVIVVVVVVIAKKRKS